VSARGVVWELRASLDERSQDVVTIVLHPPHKSMLQVRDFCDVHLRTGLQCV
jgi:hypothetical protein